MNECVIVHLCVAQQIRCVCICVCVFIFRFNQSNCTGCPINGNVEVSIQYTKNCKSRSITTFDEWEAQVGLVVERHEEAVDPEQNGQNVKDEL